MNISEMLATNARRYPDDTALIQIKPGEKLRQEITWREFDQRANRVASALVDRGIKKGDKVIHWMRNSINWLEAYFGIIRTGAWAVPLNYRFSSSDLKYCADIAEAKVMILGEEFRESVETTRSQLPTIERYILVSQHPPKDMESFEEVIDKASSKPVEIKLHDEDGCGLYFTSGTTGTPKSILHTHKNMEAAAITETAQHYQHHSDNLIRLRPL